MTSPVKATIIISALSLLLLLSLGWSNLPFPSQTQWQRTDLSFLADPDFRRENLPKPIHAWYDRLWSAIHSQNQVPNSTEYAESNDTFKYGRMLNSHITHLLTVLRVTGDPALLYEIDRLSELMRNQLKDWSITTLGEEPVADGYLNWQYFYDREYVGSDVMVMDEMLAHSLVAAMAYALHVNRAMDHRFGEHADFWVDYLKNHFEAKWRRRNNISSGNFLDKDLAHPYTQWIRYNYYMYKLTGDNSYREEVMNRVNVINNHMIVTDDGSGFAWDHRITEIGQNPTWGCQPFVYCRQTMEALLDLYLEDDSLFPEPFMTRLAGTVRMHILNNGSVDFAPDVCGDVPVKGLKPSHYPREDQRRYATSGFTLYAAWDPSGTVRQLSQEVYFAIESDPAKPNRIFIPSGIIFDTLHAHIVDVDK